MARKSRTSSQRVLRLIFHRDQQKTDLVNWTCSRPVASHPRLEALSLEITNLNAEEARIDPLTEDDFFQGTSKLSDTREESY